MANDFRNAIIDRLREMAKANGNKLALGVDVVKAAAFPAFEEACGAAAETPSPIECAIVWEGVLKMNESAFRQGLERDQKAGTLGFTIVGSARTAKGLSLQYLPKAE